MYSYSYVSHSSGKQFKTLYLASKSPPAFVKLAYVCPYSCK